MVAPHATTPHAPDAPQDKLAPHATTPHPTRIEPVGSTAHATNKVDKGSSSKHRIQVDTSATTQADHRRHSTDDDCERLFGPTTWNQRISLKIFGLLNLIVT